MRPELQTNRLRLRPWGLADLELTVNMDLDTDVGRYLYFHEQPTAEQRREVTRERMTSDWPPVGGMWFVDWADSGESLGWCGLFPLEDSGLIEIGYHFVTAAWGQGVATEAGTRVLDYGFRELAPDPIVAVTHPENAGSQNVLRKIGLRSEGLRFHYGLNLSFFFLDRDSYLTFR